jgi:hypothetical protein
MNHKYKDIQEALAEVGTGKNYLTKALREYGFEKFPKSGLEDEEKNKVICKAVSLAYPLPEKQIKPSGKLEIIVGELKKLIPFVTAPIENTLRAPTMMRKVWEDLLCHEEDLPEGRLTLDAWRIAAGLTEFVGGISVYKNLTETNPKLIPYILGTLITTNVISGIYEYVRHVKNKSEETQESIDEYNRKEIELHGFDPVFK